MADGLGPAIIFWGALAMAGVVAVLVKNRVRPPWRIYQFHWREAMPVWWSIAWRAALYGVVGGHFIGNAARVIAMFTSHSDLASPLGSVATWLAAFIFSIIAVKQALQLHVGRLSGAVDASTPAN